jgi:hypothetical protein
MRLIGSKIRVLTILESQTDLDRISCRNVHFMQDLACEVSIPSISYVPIFGGKVIFTSKIQVFLQGPQKVRGI